MINIIYSHLVKIQLKFFYCTLNSVKTYAILKKILHSFVLILLEQYCTGQNSMKPCVRGSRQHWVRKNLVQYCLNTPGAKLRRKNPMQCCLRGSKQHCTAKNLGNVCLNNVWSFRLHKYIRFFM